MAHTIFATPHEEMPTIDRERILAWVRPAAAAALVGVMLVLGTFAFAPSASVEPTIVHSTVSVAPEPLSRDWVWQREASSYDGMYRAER